MDRFLNVPGLAHIGRQIFGYLEEDDIDSCLQVSQEWHGFLYKHYKEEHIKNLEKLLHKKKWSYDKSQRTEKWIANPEWRFFLKYLKKQGGFKIVRSIANTFRFMSKSWDRTPAHIAIQNGPKFMEAMLNIKSDMKVPDGFSSLLDFVAFRSYGCRCEIFEFLITNATKYGLDIHCRDSSGSTFLHTYCSTRDTYSIELKKSLFDTAKDMGINLDATDNSGSTILHRASAEYHYHAVKALLAGRVL